VRRPLGAIEPRTEWCEPPDPTQHAIGAVALGSLALMTRGLPEYEARAADRGSELCLTLLRCVGLISRATDEIETRPMTAGPRMATPEGQCLGRHVLEYALLFDADQRSDVALLRASQDYRSPLLIVPTGADFGPPLTLDGDVVFSCLKGAEDGDGLILRVFNPGSAPASLRVGGAVSIERLRLDETCAEPLAERVAEVGVGEIATLRLRASA
jgi:mannosylglycerate hydrolase